MLPLALHPRFILDFISASILVVVLLSCKVECQVTYVRDRVHTYSVYAPTTTHTHSFRQARSDDSSSLEYQPFPPRTRLFMSADQPSPPTSVVYTSPGSLSSSSSSSSSSSPSSQSSSSSTYNSLPSVIKHMGTCSRDRSQAACTFSLICFLANGVPSEGCDDDASVTCCYLNAKKSVASLSSSSSLSPSSSVVSNNVPHPVTHKTESSVHSSSPLIYRTYSSSYESSPTSASMSLPSSSYHQSIVSSPSSPVSGYTFSPKHSSINKYPSYLSMMPETTSNKLAESSGNNVLDTFKPMAPYEMKPYHISSSSSPSSPSSYMQPLSSSLSDDHSAVRRSRMESGLAAMSKNGKSYFHEVASRKLYARKYDPDDFCGKPMAKPRSRIIGGQDAYFGEFPWQALINAQFVVTASHCIYQAPMRQLNVIIGAHDIEDPRYQDTPPQYFGVSKVILHPNFRFSASHPDRYDIALIKLDKEVRYSDSVLPVCLPDENVHFEGWKGVVTGWGKTDPALSNRYGTRLLQKVEVPVINNDKCELWHRARGIDLRIFSEMMCAGYEEGLRDACVGDSGGPLTINVNGRWTLAGITSAGFGCAQSKQPGIYHRVANTVEWIKSTVKLEMEFETNSIHRSK